MQPPSGGCVLKHNIWLIVKPLDRTAAFGRLCVETSSVSLYTQRLFQPPSGGCVLKHKDCEKSDRNLYQPPSGGCVLKLRLLREQVGQYPAAFGRLCVETPQSTVTFDSFAQPPSGGCVLKPRT